MPSANQLPRFGDVRVVNGLAHAAGGQLRHAQDDLRAFLLTGKFTEPRP